MDGKTPVCDKRDRAINCLFCRDLHFTLMFSGLLQKDLFEGRWSLTESFCKQNYCHACHTRFSVLFPLPSCCVIISSLIVNFPLFLPRLEKPLTAWNVPFKVSPELPCFSYTDRMSALGGLRNVTCSYNCWSNEPKFWLFSLQSNFNEMYSKWYK